MANDNRNSNTSSNTSLDKPQKQETAQPSKDEKSAVQHPPVEQVNPDHGGLNPDHLGPAQPRKPGA